MNDCLEHHGEPKGASQRQDLGFIKETHMANRNFLSQKLFSGHAMPVHVDCNFVVDSTNGNGLGIRSLKGAYVQNVYMNTSSTPAAGNPNPAPGTIVIQLADNFNYLYIGGSSVVSPIGTPSNTLSAGVAVIVTSAGSTTSAQWLAAGVPAGVLASGTVPGIPNVGTAFISLISGAMGGSGTAAPTAAAGSGIFSFETVGDSNQSIAPAPAAAQGYGAQVILQTRNASGSSAASAIVAPANGTVIALSFLLSNSSVTVNGD